MAPRQGGGVGTGMKRNNLYIAMATAVKSFHLVHTHLESP